MDSLKEDYSTLLIISSLILIIIVVSAIFFKNIYDPEKLEANTFYLYLKLLFRLIYFKFDYLLMVKYLSNCSKQKGYIHLKIFNKNIIFLSSPDYIQDLLSNTENIDRPFVSSGLKGFADESILVINGENWIIKRNLINPIFRKTALDNYLKVIEKNTVFLVKDLYNNVNREWISITPILSYYTFKNAIETLLNYPENSQSLRNYSVYTKCFHEIAQSFWNRSLNILYWNDFIFNLTSKGKAYFSASNLTKNVLRKEINDRIESIKETMKTKDAERNMTVFDHLLISSEYNPDITKDYLIDEMIILIAGAEHTTKITISCVLHFLGKLPHIQKRVQDEIDYIFENENSCCISKNLQKMTYLECVIKETMRIFPAVPIISRTAEHEFQLDDKRIPKNSFCFISIYNIHHDPRIFANSEIFDPDRHTKENSSNRHHFSFIPFSKGIRMCIGNNFSMMVMKISLAYILRNFCIESYPEKLTYTLNGFFIDFNESIKIKFKPRKIN